VWPRDQLLHFGDDPHHYPDPGVRYLGRTATILLCWHSARSVLSSTSSYHCVRPF